jgi:hypothetical protein
MTSRRPARPGRAVHRALIALAALAVTLVAPAAASALVAIDGTPLNVFAGDSGRLQARYDGVTTGEFYSPSSDEADAGFNLGTDIGGSSPQLWGYLGSSFTAESQSPVTGDGSPGSPLQQTTRYSTGPIAADESTFTVDQTIFYVNGENLFRVRYTVTHSGGGQPIVVRPMLSADLYINGSDVGTGFFNPGPPRIVGGVNHDTGGTGGIVELTPWQRYEEDQYTTVDSHVADLSPSGGLDNSINPEAVDNGVGIQWADTTLCGGCTSSAAPASATYEGAWRFTRFQALDLAPDASRHIVGQTARLAVSATGAEGEPAQVNVHYEVSGANSATGVVRTGPDGRAEISYVGANSGFDTVDVFADLNGNGVRDGGEPRRQATVEWLGQPEVGRTANVEPVEGEVFVKLPPGANAARYGLRAKASQNAPAGFIPLTQASQIPIRSELDTTRGRVMLQSSRGTTGGTQTAEFFSGRFQVTQRRARRAVTEMVMRGGSFRRCGSSRGVRPAGDVNASRRAGRRVRRVWGRGRGRFRTRGRYSSATVRGTTWLVEDRCNATLTRLPRRPRGSRVLVRDFVQRKTITLRSGQSYQAFRRR